MRSERSERPGPLARAAAARIPLALLCAVGLFGAAGRAVAQQPLPIQTTAYFLDPLNPAITYQVDLGTLPTRPILVAEVASQPDVVLEIEITGWTSPQTGFSECPHAAESLYSPPSQSGSTSVSIPLYNCYPLPSFWTGYAVDVRVRVVSFGPSGPPATASVVIRAETRPPTATLAQQVDTNLGPRQVEIRASKDAVLYQNNPSASNGAGQFLWAGTQLTSAPPSVLRRRRNSLLAFDLSAAISPVATIDAVDLGLEVTGLIGGGGVLSLYRVAPRTLFSWAEGDADAPDPEVDGAVSTSGAADWQYRYRPLEAWSSAGGDVTGAPLLQRNVTSLGPIVLASSVFRDAVQEMVTSQDDDDGFLLSGPPGTLASEGIQLASSENPSVLDTPLLIVHYTQAEIYEDGGVPTGVVNFVNEGQNFRWIYDLDQDDVLITNIGGVCEVLDYDEHTFMSSLPYTYRFQGIPGYTGVDCCTWKIDAPQSGTVGTGQALFFHNLDAGNPANMPPDIDQDGIRDLCDNCPSAPNGPLRGSCKSGTAIGAVCHSDQECVGDGVCDLAQEDTDGNFQGDACPEPGFAAGLFVGLGLLTALTRRRRPPFESSPRGPGRFPV